MPPPAILRLTDSTRRLVRTVDGFDEDAFAAPSLLPGWTRSHVVAHLALNAEAMTRAVEGVRAGGAVALYDSKQSRDDDIEEVAHLGCSDLRERFLGSAARFAEAIESLPENLHEHEAEWFPGAAMRRPFAAFPDIRRGEVEIHHVDLGTSGYDHTAWPGDFAAWVVDARAAAATPEAGFTPFTAYAGDLDRRWSFAGGADGDPMVTGPATELARWVAGRGDASGLECDGTLPRIGAW